MQLLFRQRFVSLFDTYDIYNEQGYVVYKISGRLSLGKSFTVEDYTGVVGEIKQKLLVLFPEFEIYSHGQYTGCIKKKFTFIGSSFDINYMGWRAEGDLFGFNYSIADTYNRVVARITKKIFNFTDTYVIDVYNNRDILHALMFVVAVDALKDLSSKYSH